jgi:hypothetical protein
MNRLMSWVIRGAIILNLLGFFMDATWLRNSEKPGYFTYKIVALGDFPYWLFSTLLFLAVNGGASLYFAGIKFRASQKEGNYEGGFPLPPIKLLGINLILIPFLIVLFIIVRAIGL